MSGTIWRTAMFDPSVTVRAGETMHMLPANSPRPPGATTRWPVARAKHCDGTVADVWITRSPEPQPETVFPCFACGHPFDHVLLGRYGCPNCHGEGLGPRVHP